jgi:uncharacterized protein (TIGR01777 family)
MKILISGATGMVGSELFMDLHKEGHQVLRLVRTAANISGADILWDPQTGITEKDRFEGFDAVIHLAGESIAAGRWTAKKKARIQESRVTPTKHLSSLLASLQTPPKVFVVASAIGFYGNRGDAALDETSSPGTGFLPDVCKAWEEATQPAAQKGIRVVNLRFGIILSPTGGALAKMLCPFKMGVGGILGDGKQVMSWISLDDAVVAVKKSLSDAILKGPVNVVSPEPVTNTVFTKTMGEVLVRPTLLPMPAFAARLAFGEMADALLLSSARVLPKKLEAVGFQFKYKSLDAALRGLLSR